MPKTRQLTTVTAVLVGAITLAVVAIVLTGGTTTARAAAVSRAVTPAGLRPETPASDFTCLPHFATGNACASLIGNSTGKYCLSSFGSRTGSVREWPCDPNSDNQIWYIEPSGAYGDFEVWNYGDSCPADASLSGDQCGTPNGPAASGNPNYNNYGFCIYVKGGTGKQNAELVMSQCSDGSSPMDPPGSTFLKPMTFKAIGPFSGNTGGLSFAAVHAGSPSLWVSTRGQSRPGATYVLQTATKANEKDLEFDGSTLGFVQNFQGLGTYPPGGSPGELQ